VIAGYISKRGTIKYPGMGLVLVVQIRMEFALNVQQEPKNKNGSRRLPHYMVFPT